MPSFKSLHAEYGADTITKKSPRYLLHRGTTILALLLKEHYNRRILSHGEVWFGSYPEIDNWGSRLANLKGTDITLPVYFYPMDGPDYTLQGWFKVIGDTTVPEVLETARSNGAPVPLSRIVYLEKVNHEPHDFPGA